MGADQEAGASASTTTCRGISFILRPPLSRPDWQAHPTLPFRVAGKPARRDLEKRLASSGELAPYDRAAIFQASWHQGVRDAAPPNQPKVIALGPADDRADSKNIEELAHNALPPTGFETGKTCQAGPTGQTSDGRYSLPDMQGRENLSVKLLQATSRLRRLLPTEEPRLLSQEEVRSPSIGIRRLEWRDSTGRTL